MLNWRLEEREYVSNKVDEYLKNIPSLSRIFMSDKQLNKNIKPFQIEAKPYDNFSDPTLSQVEIITIHCEPLKLSFIQENIDRKEV